jgi:hypothetical protein
MKKVIFSALTILMLSTVAVFAQDVTPQDNPATTQDQDRPAADDSHEMRTEVQLQELPEAVTSTLMSEEYQEWTPTASYIVKDENETEQYAVELQKEEETKTVTFDSQGNKVDKEKEEDLE